LGQEIPELENRDAEIPGAAEINDGDKPIPPNGSEPLPPRLTVLQFLKRAPQKSGIDGLIRSLYSSRVMSFEEWEKEIETLLKKRIS
jgi:hypothetical protein